VVFAPESKRRDRSEDGVSILEYVLLVALVAMLSVGALLYLGRSSSTPARVANNVADNVGTSGASSAAAGANSTTGNGGNDPAGNAGNDPANSPTTTSVGSGTTSAVKVWCTSGQAGCSDPMYMNGQAEYIHFWASGGVQPYTYKLAGAPPFMSLDSAQREIVVQPTDCAQDVGTYSGISIVVTDSASPPNTGQLDFSLTVAKGSSC
jgi:hypothetical protein